MSFTVREVEQSGRFTLQKLDSSQWRTDLEEEEDENLVGLHKHILITSDHQKILKSYSYLCIIL